MSVSSKDMFFLGYELEYSLAHGGLANYMSIKVNE
jgi:hypothetical protein